MILQALKQYYDRREGELAPPGWTHKPVDIVILLNPEGTAIQINDLREPQGKKKVGIIELLPSIGKQAEKHTNSGSDANLLWDNSEFLFGLGKNGLKTTQAFFNVLEEYFPGSNDEGVTAVKRLFANLIADPGAMEAIRRQLPTDKDGSIARLNVAFRLAGSLELISSRPAVKERLLQSADNGNITIPYGDNGPGICLITGERTTLINNHTAIKGIPGGQASGGYIVSFNKECFRSYYGKKTACCAPIGKLAMFAYTTALKALLVDNQKQHMQIGDITIVFWSALQTKFENEFANFLSEPPKDDPNRGIEAVKALFESPESGAWLEPEGKNLFYVLGLSPNAARISIPFWITGTVADMASHIRQHFTDLRLVHGVNDPDRLSLFRLLRETAVRRKVENIPAKLAGETMRAILTGGNYPQTLLGSLIRRIWADGEISYSRASFIKACINRDVRKHGSNHKEDLTMGLDPNNTNRGYRLGRLFAVLEKVQQEAQGTLNATIRDRFYATASSAPASVFGTLLRTKNHHLAMLNPGRRTQFEQMFSEIFFAIDEIPNILPLADQGRFAIGYYHQMQNLFTSKKDQKDAGNKQNSN
jgi:CRISPR-associated protein Csd1